MKFGDRGLILQTVSDLATFAKKAYDSWDGKLIDDFLFLETPRTLHVCNAPSPAATSALPIADEIMSRALRKAN